MMGFAGGAAGTGFASPQQAAIQTPTTSEQAKTSYDANQKALAQQQGLLDALKQQNGLQNQSDVYNQLQGVANGTGPNPAQAMLNQATAANTANQAAMMAGQRGSSANPALIARQAAMQGAANQQNAAGQGATMQAQQSMNALQGMGNLANTQTANQIGATGAMTSAQQAEQSNLLNAIAQQNNAKVGMQSNINNVNGQLANTQLQGQQAMIGGAMQGIGGGVSSLMGAEGGEVKENSFEPPMSEHESTDQGPPNPLPEMQIPVQQASTPAPEQAENFGNFNSKVDGGNTPSVSTPTFGTSAGAEALGKGMSGMMGGGSKSKDGGGGGMASMLPMLAMLADGGNVQQAGPKSKFGQFISKVAAPKDESKAEDMNANTGSEALFKGAAAMTGAGFKGPKSSAPAPSNYAQGQPGMGNFTARPMAEGGPVPAMVSPGERYLAPNDVKAVKQGANPMQVGEKIPGQPKVGGAKNSYANDTVPKTLEEGGIVLPRSVTQSKHPHWAAHKFVMDIMKQKNQKKGKKK